MVKVNQRNGFVTHTLIHTRRFPFPTRTSLALRYRLPSRGRGCNAWGELHGNIHVVASHDLHLAQRPPLLTAGATTCKY